ncbi:methyltransferase domain-containing protein [Candidatus Woesearchaeota archaeon]|nr:methyltransferase domain-containing protein [Candidatus Woesearchaeota archaeon]
MDVEKSISRRTHCPACSSKNLSQALKPHIELPYPLLPVCVDTLRSEDITVPYTIIMCQDCGLIMLRDTIDPQVLYEIFHSDGIGKVWGAHYTAFAEVIKKHHKKGRVLEIGAGQGKLIKKLLPHHKEGIEVIDPMYEGDRKGIVVHDMLLTEKNAEEMAEQFTTICSSHTLEHFIEYNDYFSVAWTCLKIGGKLITAVPNMESSFSLGYGNQLNFEHPGIALNLHWIMMHYSHGFVVREISTFRDHSIYLVAEKVAEKVELKVNIKEYAEKVLERHTKSIHERIHIIRKRATDGKENWIFGASNFSQPLFMYGLDESLFVGVMDNSPLKHNKRLYGTGLICRKPEDVVGKKKNLRVFLNLGHYNEEVNEQLKGLDPDVECIFL